MLPPWLSSSPAHASRVASGVSNVPSHLFLVWTRLPFVQWAQFLCRCPGLCVWGWSGMGFLTDEGNFPRGAECIADGTRWYVVSFRRSYFWLDVEFEIQRCALCGVFAAWLAL